ncbi:hypothetical protein CCACVL1_07322, partial [Corchorus capsularis]
QYVADIANRSSPKAKANQPDFDSKISSFPSL